MKQKLLLIFVSLIGIQLTNAQCLSQAGIVSTTSSTSICQTVGVGDTLNVDITYTTAPVPTDQYVFLIVDDATLNIEAFQFAGFIPASTTVPIPILGGLAVGTYKIYGSNIDVNDPDLFVAYPGGPGDLIGAPYSGWVSLIENLGGVTVSGDICGDNTTSFIAFSVLPQGDPTFSYPSNSYMTSDGDPTPTVATSGGIFTSNPAGLSIDPSTGIIDVSSSMVGTYTVLYNLCTISGFFSVNITNTLSVDEFSLENQIRLFPNPNTGIFTLNYSGNAQLKELSVTDITAKKISAFNLSGFNGSQEINLSDLAKGLYFISIETNTAKVVKRILIK